MATVGTDRGLGEPGLNTVHMKNVVARQLINLLTRFGVDQAHGAGEVMLGSADKLLLLV